MSYQRMDHAEWVESSNAAGKRRLKKPRTEGRDGHPIGYAQAPDHLSLFQARVMDILGIVFGGIYNAPINWETVDWNHGRGLSVVVARSNGFSTFDFNRLTEFVFLCHEARIRGQIEPVANGYMRLSFWQRSHEGGIASRHPNLDEAVADFRKYMPTHHRIFYREAAPVSSSHVAVDANPENRRQEDSPNDDLTVRG